MRMITGVRRALCLSLVVVVPRLALADLPYSTATLGQLEGILNFCSTLDPELAKNRERAMALLLGKVSPADLANARGSEEYQTAYDAISAELNKMDRQHAAETCSKFTQGK
jgi:hypothetical protein